MIIHSKILLNIAYGAKGGGKLRCFECNSHLDPACTDPFNWTTAPVTKRCDGCCVKIVQGIDTRKFLLVSVMKRMLLLRAH